MGVPFKLGLAFFISNYFSFPIVRNNNTTSKQCSIDNKRILQRKFEIIELRFQFHRLISRNKAESSLLLENSLDKKMINFYSVSGLIKTQNVAPSINICDYFCRSIDSRTMSWPVPLHVPNSGKLDWLIVCWFQNLLFAK